MAASIPIAVELGAGCAPLARAQRLDVFRERLGGEVDDMLARLGIAGQAALTVDESDSRRAVRVRIHGSLRPYPAGLARRLWRVIAPDDLLGLAEEVDPSGAPDAWFSDYVAGLAEGSEPPDWTLALELVQRVVRDALWERAGCLVGPDQAEAFLRGASLAEDSAIDTGAMLAVLRGLADLAVPVVARDRLVLTVERCARRGLSLEDTFEEALAATRPKRVEILADPGYLAALASGEGPQQIVALERELLLGRGVRLPAVELVPTTKLRPGMVAVRVNGRSSPFPVDADPPSFDALMPRLVDEIGRRAHLLLDVQEAEIRVGQLQELFPSLAEALIRRLSLADLTRILRELLREGVSIHDLKTISELLLEFDTVPADPQQYVVLDERLPLAYRPGRGRPDWRSRLEFVRRGLAYQLSAACSRGGRIDAIVVDPALASGAAARLNGGPGGLGEAEQEAVRDALCAQLERLWAAGSRPVVYTACGGRAAIRELLAPEFPALAVLAAAEVRRGIAVQEVGRIGLPGSVSEEAAHARSVAAPRAAPRTRS
jgi:hypothetical protein